MWMDSKVYSYKKPVWIVKKFFVISGEENDIILLSLVRSNDKRNIGFLATDNRVCVALTRARYEVFSFHFNMFRILLNVFL